MGITQIPNLAYATTIATAFRTTLKVASTPHGTMPNNPNLIPTSINLSFQQFIIATTNIPPTIDALAFTNPMGEFFQVIDLEFLIKSFKKKLQLDTFS